MEGLNVGRKGKPERSPLQNAPVKLWIHREPGRPPIRTMNTRGTNGGQRQCAEAEAVRGEARTLAAGCGGP